MGTGSLDKKRAAIMPVRTSIFNCFFHITDTCHSWVSQSEKLKKEINKKEKNFI